MLIPSPCANGGKDLDQEFKSFDGLELQNLIKELDDKQAEVFRKALKLFDRLLAEKEDRLEREILAMQKKAEDEITAKCDAESKQVFKEVKDRLMKWARGVGLVAGSVAGLLGITTLLVGIDWFAGITANALINARPKLEETVIEKTTESFKADLEEKRQSIETAYSEAIDEAWANTQKIADDLVTAKETLQKIIEKHETPN